jgi:hypothetical protein
LSVDLGVSIGGLETDVTKPAADDVHLDTCLKKMDGGGVPENMRGNAF